MKLKQPKKSIEIKHEQQLLSEIENAEAEVAVNQVDLETSLCKLGALKTAHSSFKNENILEGKKHGEPITLKELRGYYKAHIMSPTDFIKLLKLYVKQEIQNFQTKPKIA